MSVSKTICISEPTDSPKLTPEEPSRTPEEKSKSQLTPTITEEGESEDPNINTKSSLSLPVEMPPGGGPIENTRRKLSVQGESFCNFFLK